MPSQSNSTNILTMKLPRNAISRNSPKRAMAPKRRRYLCAACMSAPVRTIAPEPSFVEHTGDDDERHGPAELGQQSIDEIHVADFAQEDHRREVSHVLKRQRLEHAAPE